MRFDDTEGERTTAIDDTFELIVVDKPKRVPNRIEVNGMPYRFKICVNKSSKKKLT